MHRLECLRFWLLHSVNSIHGYLVGQVLQVFSLELERDIEQARDLSMLIKGKGSLFVNPLTPDNHYRGRTAPLTSKRCILYIYSTDIGTEYFKHGIYSPFFPSSKCSLFHNSNVFGYCIIHILYTGCAKIKKIILV